MTRHDHDWSPWSEWYFVSDREDGCDRDCQDPDCGETETRYREHEHLFRCVLCHKKEK